MSDADDDRNPLESLVDYALYAPLGFALEARTLLPRFIDRGRNQVVLARVVGRYSVKKGAAAVDSLLGPLGSTVNGALGALGLVPDEPTAPPSSTGAEPVAPTAGEPTGVPTAPVATVTPMRPEPPFDPAQLAIPDYDSLSASQVLPRLESLSESELEAVRAYEDATRARKTILNKIVQLQRPA